MIAPTMTLETGTIPLSDTTTLAPGLDEESFRAAIGILVNEPRRATLDVVNRRQDARRQVIDGRRQ